MKCAFSVAFETYYFPNEQISGSSSAGRRDSCAVVRPASGTGFALPTVASATKTIPTCLNTQLEVAVAWGPGGFAGNDGGPFIIDNIGKSTCTLDGYPKLDINYAYKKSTVKVIDGGGMVYVAVGPRLVLLKPGADASFGLDYGDAANQQDPNGSACTAQYVYVTLPVRYAVPQNYETTVIFNFCYTNFRVEVTSIQAGPVPKLG
jgi:hypothetical protein